MTDGPTTEGSIVAYLRLNTSDWKEKLDEADAQARGLPNPDIRINVEAADAMAKIEAVRAAEARLGGTTGGGSGAGKIDEVAVAQKRLTAAESAAETAYARAAVAAMRLDEVENKRGRTELQVASAVLANSEAQKRLTAANEKATAAEEALAEAEKRAAAAALEQATAGQGAADAVNEQAAAADKANASNATNVSRMQVIGIAVAALIPLLGPLAGTVVGLAGGFAGMGAAGVLAIFGIKNAMAAGTQAGSEYTQMLGGLKSEFNQLAQTSAVALLSDFQQAANLIAADMPSLNGEIAQFASILGGASVSAVDGVVNGLQTMNPLFVEGANLIAQIAAGFDTWTQNGGLQQFTTYAQRELPQVMRTIGLVSDAIVKFTQDLSPAGDGMVALIGDAAELGKGLLWLNDQFHSFMGTYEKANKDFKDNPILGAIVSTFSQTDLIGAFSQHMGDLNTMLGMTGDTATKTAPKVATSTQSIGDLSKATDTARTALDKFNQQLQGLGQTNLSASQANIQYQQSLADTTAAIKTNGATLDLSTQKGRDNMSALDGIASSAISVVAAQQKAGASADTLSGIMAGARQAFINAAMAAGDTKDQANKLADAYDLIPKDVSTAFHDSGAQQAVADALAVKAAYDNIDRQITIRVNSIISNAASNPGGMGLGSGGNQTQHKSGGGSVEYHAAGGAAGAAYLALGGSPFQPQGTDTVPAMLTLGEFVVKQASAAYNPPFLKAYNDNPQRALAAVQQSGAAAQPAVRQGDFNLTIHNPVSRDPVQEIRKAQQMRVVEQGSYV